MKALKIIGILVVVLLVIGACSSISSVPDPIEPEQKAEAVPEPVKEEKEEVKEVVKEPEVVIDDSVYIALVMETLNNYLGDTCKISLNEDEKVFEVLPYDDDLVMAFTLVAAGDETVAETYRTTVEEFKKLSATISKELPDYALAIVNPYNHDNYLLVVMHGFVFYNFADEL